MTFDKIQSVKFLKFDAFLQHMTFFGTLLLTVRIGNFQFVNVPKINSWIDHRTIGEIVARMTFDDSFDRSGFVTIRDNAPFCFVDAHSSSLLWAASDSVEPHRLRNVQLSMYGGTNYAYEEERVGETPVVAAREESHNQQCLHIMMPSSFFLSKINKLTFYFVTWEAVALPPLSKDLPTNSSLAHPWQWRILLLDNGNGGRGVTVVLNW